MSATGTRRASRPPAIREMGLETRPFALLAPALSAAAWRRLDEARDNARELLGGRRVWSVSSTASGGGVAEMMRSLLPYWRGAGLDARWVVIEAPDAFFRVTRRLHELLHGMEDVRPPGAGDRALYERVSRALGAELLQTVAPGDVVILQDPQTAGLTPALARAGIVVVWRCHVGADHVGAPGQAAWSFLLPDLKDAAGFVFTRHGFVAPGLDPGRTHLLAPAIDPCSPKNRVLSAATARAILVRSGLAGSLVTTDPAPTRRLAYVVRDGEPPTLGAARLVVALGRWDALKDPIGIVQAFGRHVDDPRAHLVVAGPAVTAVSDDPDARRVFAAVRAAWRALPDAQRGRVQLATLPMADVEENALIVNALQTEAEVVVKKSLQEGFGLGVTEALWKARPVVATAVGGHLDQIEHGRTGLLVDDPGDLAAFGAAVNRVLADPEMGHDLGIRGREHVREHFLADRQFAGWIRILDAVLRGAAPTARQRRATDCECAVRADAPCAPPPYGRITPSNDQESHHAHPRRDQRLRPHRSQRRARRV